jgi:hypothetical protein
MTLAALFACVVVVADVSGADGDASRYAGLRRSTYSWEDKKPKLCRDNAWWAGKARKFAASLSGNGVLFQPVVIEIVSIYLDNGHCEMEFAQPKGIAKPKGVDFFNPKASINHEKALSVYDEMGVKAIIQIEPGDADVAECLELVHAAFGKHPCVIGYGVDAEWYRTKGSKKNEGIPIADADAKLWMEKVLAFGTKYTLFLKHWDTSHMPPTFRHHNLWFLSDSQQFGNLKGLIDDFSDWGKHYRKQTVGFQFGYPEDSKWWRKLSKPTRDISLALIKEIPNAKYLFWVDFTAPNVEF